MIDHRSKGLLSHTIIWAALHILFRDQHSCVKRLWHSFTQYQLKPDIQQGDNGKWVRFFQEALILEGYPLVNVLPNSNGSVKEM